jgi:hypothetical protein
MKLAQFLVVQKFQTSDVPPTGVNRNRWRAMKAWLLRRFLAGDELI